ncbi:hypothetical protein D3C73_1376360 [compost metagenome]
MNGDTADVGTAHATGFRVAARWHHVDERLVCVALLEQCLQVDRLIGNSRVQGRVNAADHRGQMRHEGQADVRACSQA